MIRYCRLFVTAACALLFSVTAITGAFARDKKDYILILDTSYSMAGSGGRNIIESVKNSLGVFLEKEIQNGDTLTFATFADDVVFYPTVLIEDKNDKDIVKKYISMVQAKGSWTYTYEMVKRALAKAEELQRAKKDHQIVIVVMTDLLDDPPPSKRKQRMSIKDLAKSYPGGEWYVYLVSLNDMKNNDKVKALAGDLSASIPGTKVINASDADKGMAGLKEAEKAADDKKARDKLLWMIFIIIGIILLLVALAALFRYLYEKYFAFKLSGSIEYRYIQSPYKEFDTADLKRINQKRVEMAKGTQFRINLRDYTENTPVVLQAKRFGNVVRPTVVEDQSAPVEFLNNKKTSFLVDGDSFKAGGYLFIYREGK